MKIIVRLWRLYIRFRNAKHRNFQHSIFNCYVLPCACILAYITLQDNKKGFLLRRRVCRPPAAVPSSEEGSAKLHGGHPPGLTLGYLKHITAARSTNSNKNGHIFLICPFFYLTYKKAVGKGRHFVKKCSPFFIFI